MSRNWLLLLTLLATEVHAAPPRTTQTLGPIKVGKAAPLFGSFSVRGGLPIALEPVLKKGVSAVVVSFFATDCKPCIVGLPRLQRTLQAHPDARGVLVAVGERGPAVGRFLDDLGIELPAVSDKFFTVAEQYGVDKSGIPKTVVLDRRGRVDTIFIEETPGFEAALGGVLKRLAKTGQQAPTR